MDEFGDRRRRRSRRWSRCTSARSTVALPASGSLGDRFGHRPVFLVGVVGVRRSSSLLAAVAPSFEVLALSRVLQAVSGALVSTTSVALVRAMSPPDRRGAAFGLFDMLVSTSAAIGPFIGGAARRRRSAGGRCSSSRCRSRCSPRSWSASVVPPGTGPRDPAPDRRARQPRPIDVPGLVLLRRRCSSRSSSRSALRGGRGDGGIASSRPSPSSRCSCSSSGSSCGPTARRSIRACSPAARSRRPSSACSARP